MRLCGRASQDSPTATGLFSNPGGLQRPRANLTPCLAAAEIHKHFGDICQMGTLRPTYPRGAFVPDSCMNLMSLKLRSSLRYSSFHLRTITIVEVSTFCFTALAKKLLRRCSPFPSLGYWMVNEVF